MALKLTKRELSLVLVVVLATLMYTLDISLANISIPSIIRDYHTTVSMGMWVLLAYGLSLSSFLLLFGKVGDRIGFKPVFALGFGIFVVGTFLSYTAGNINDLIIFRFLQGIGSAMIAALAFATVTKYLPPTARGLGLGAVAAAGALGACIGPTLGGWIVSSYGFHSIFLVNIPIGLAAIVLTLWVVPMDRAKAKKPFDYIGAVTIFIGLFALTYALNMGHQDGWTSPTILACWAGTVIFIPGFVLWELKKAKDPLLDMNLCRKRSVLMPALSSMMAMAAVSGAFVLMPFYFEIIKLMNSSSAGQMFLWATVTMVFAGVVAGYLSDKISSRMLAIASLSLGGFAVLMMATIDRRTELLVVGIMLMGLGLGAGLYYPPVNRMIMINAPPELQGQASSFTRTMQQVGSTFGVAVFTTILTSYTGIHDLWDVVKFEKHFMEGMSMALLVGAAFVLMGVVFLLLAGSGEKKVKAG